MTLHAGPYDLDYEAWMLARCLDDFELRPERNFALVDSEAVHQIQKGREVINVWADGYVMNPVGRNFIKKGSRG